MNRLEMCSRLGFNKIGYRREEVGRVSDGMRTGTISAKASMRPPLTPPERRGTGYTYNSKALD